MVTLVPIGAIGGGGGTSGPINPTDIVGVTAVGQASMTPVDQTAGRAAIGAAADAVVVKLTGDQTVAGIKTHTSIPVLPASDPTTANQAARKAYVDSASAAAASSAAAGVTAAGIGAVPAARLVAGQALSADVPASTLTAALSTATTTAKGTVELATSTEAIAGTDAALAITASTMSAAMRPLFVTLTPYWPLRWVVGTGWPARTTIPQWYRDLGGLARYIADDPTIVAGSVTLPTDKQDKDRIYTLPGLIPGT